MRKLIIKSLFVFGILFLSGTVSSQERKLNKAKKQYDKYEYINAQETYLKVVEKGYKSTDLLKNLGNSYYFNSEFEEALKWYEDLVNSYPEKVEPEYLFRYAQTLKAVKRYKDSDVYMKKFAAINLGDQRAELFKKEPDYLKRIELQSGRFKIKNTAINSSFTDFGTAFYGDQVVFSSSRDTLLLSKNIHQWNDESFLDFFSADYDTINGVLSNVKKFDQKLNSRFHESTPVFTKDGQTIYFTRTTLGSKSKKGKMATNHLKIYRSYKNEKGDWSTPESLPFNNVDYSVAHPALSEDNQILYFSSDMPGGKGLSDLYQVSIHSDGTFGTLINLGDRINTEGKETFPFVSANNDLYFSSDGHVGLGGLDVFVTKLNPESEEENLVVNIGKPINSPKDDFTFVIDEASKRGFFSSNRDGGKGRDDIYSLHQLEGLRSFCEITINGLVTDKDTNELLPGAKASIIDTNNNLLDSVIVGDDAFYTQKVKCNAKYFIRAELEGYLTIEKLFNAPKESLTTTIDLVLEKKIKSAGVGDDLSKILSLNPIYFDFDKSNIRPDAEIELAKVIEVMNKYPEMIIEVGSHTDTHGNDKYNLKLSDRRAKSTVDFMISKGISSDRISGKGYGETKAIYKCDKESNCKTDECQLNRRSEFVIKN